MSHREDNREFPCEPTECADSALQALCLVARLHHVAADPATLRHRLGKPASEALAPDDLLLAARHLGLKAQLSATAPERLRHTALPALALMRDGTTVVLAQCDGQRVLIQRFSAAESRPTIEPLDVFLAAWTGNLVLVTSRATLAGELAKFDFSWFIPAVVKHRKLLGEVLLVSCFLQLFALVSPLFFQVVMDKVLVHNGVSTLDVLVVGLGVVVVFESLLTALRAYVFSHTTSRIDVELGSRLYRHLLALPLAYFQARRVGDSVARVRELENIRSFLTGSALTLVLDVAFSAVFVLLMFAYSMPLTLIVLTSLPLYAALSSLVVPLLRTRLAEKFARGAENQALLVESITGVQTVKAGALEPQMARRWDEQLAAYVVDNAADVATEAASGGTDTVESTITRTLAAELENLTLVGTAAVNATGNTLNNVLVGNVAANTLSALSGADTLDGGAGADVLNGAADADTYIFSKGYGVDTVQDNDSTANVKDVIKLGAGIAQADMTYKKVGNNLEALINGTSDKIVIQDWYVGSQYHVEEFSFSDGSVLTDAQIQAKAQSLVSAMSSFAPSSVLGDPAVSDSRVHTWRESNLAVNSML